MDITSYLLGKQAGGGGVTPSGTINITSNGIVDVTDYASADVNVSSGTDLSDYFETEITSNVTPYSFRIIKKVPIIHIANGVTSIEHLLANDSYNAFITPEPIKITGGSNVTSLWGAFSYTVNQLDLTELNTSNVTTMRSCFSYAFNNPNIPFRTLDLSTWDTSKVTDINYMFSYCKGLSFIDMRTFEFTNIADNEGIFGSTANYGVPNDCEIIVKDQTQKNWVTTNYSRLTNVKTAAEYEA